MDPPLTASQLETGKGSSASSQDLLLTTPSAPDGLGTSRLHVHIDQGSITSPCEQIPSTTPAPNKILNADTPHHSKCLHPVSLFSTSDIPLDKQVLEDMEYEPSSSNTPHEEDHGDVSVDFNVHDCDLDSTTVKTILNLQTKTAQLLHRAVGDSNDITELDNLWLTLKEKKRKGKKPSQHKIQQYKTQLSYIYRCV